MSEREVTVPRRTALGIGLALAAGLATAAKAEAGKGVKVTVLYGHPKSPAAFEKYYSGTHQPLVAKVTEIPKVETSKALPGPDGKPPAFYRIADLYFDSPDQLQKVMGLPSMKAVVGDLKNFATGGATVVVSQLD